MDFGSSISNMACFCEMFGAKLMPIIVAVLFHFENQSPVLNLESLEKQGG